MRPRSIALSLMSTTTIRIEEELKERIAAAAHMAGMFHRLADERWARVLATGKTILWDEVKVYLEARARGERVRKPAVRNFKR